MKSLVVTLSFLMSASALAVTSEKITTPRGAQLEVTVHEAGPKKPTIIVAPGQSCNSKGPIFETLGKNGALAGFTVVRFEWAYCLKDPTQPIPSDNLKNEIEDYAAVLKYAQALPSVDADKIILAGKSLGSIVAYSVFQATANAKALILLTPICSYTTDENNNPLPEPQRVCEESYPGLKKDTRPVMMTMGDRDSLCILNVLFDYLKDSAGNIQVSVAGGDHGFRLKKADKTVDEAKTQRNIESVMAVLLNWADLKINAL